MKRKSTEQKKCIKSIIKAKEATKIKQEPTMIKQEPTMIKKTIMNRNINTNKWANMAQQQFMNDKLNIFKKRGTQNEITLTKKITTKLQIPHHTKKSINQLPCQLQKKKNTFNIDNKNQPNQKLVVEQNQLVIGLVTFRKGSRQRVKEYLTPKKQELLRQKKWYINKSTFKDTGMDWELLVPFMKSINCQLLCVDGTPVQIFSSLLCLPTYSKLKSLTIRQSLISNIDFLPLMNLQNLEFIEIKNTCVHSFKPLNKTNWPFLDSIYLTTAYSSQLLFNRMRMSQSMFVISISGNIMKLDVLEQLNKCQFKKFYNVEAIIDKAIEIDR